MTPRKRVSRALPLVSARFAAVVDARHGGEILALVDLERGRHVLARPPFSPEDPVAGSRDFDSWVRGYRGGWQFVGPNVGVPCTVGHEQHGFHGTASISSWRVEAATPKEVRLAWSGHGVGIRRRIAVNDEAVHVEVEARPLDERAPLLVAEHVAFGVELLDPEVAVEATAATTYEWGDDGPFAPPEAAPAWPEALLLDGRVARVDRMREESGSRLLTIADLEEGRARVVNQDRGLGYELEWETAWLRHLWLWREERTAGGPWRGRASVLVLEPASVPHDRGLAYAIERDEARWLEQGQRASYALSLRPVDIR